MPLMSYEKTLTCPYNETHQILPERFQYHLTRCSRNYPDSDLAICPFNACHRIPKSGMGYHMETCIDRKMVEIIKYTTNDTAGNTKPSTFYPDPRPNHGSNLDDENWENELVDHSYDPAKVSNKKKVLLLPRNLPKGQRREFYMKEKQRFEDLDNRNSDEEVEEIPIEPVPLPHVALRKPIFPIERPKPHQALRKPMIGNSLISKPVNFNDSESLDSWNPSVINRIHHGGVFPEVAASTNASMMSDDHPPTNSQMSTSSAKAKPRNWLADHILKIKRKQEMDQRNNPNKKTEKSEFDRMQDRLKRLNFSTNNL